MGDVDQWITDKKESVVRVRGSTSHEVVDRGILKIELIL